MQDRKTPPPDHQGSSTKRRTRLNRSFYGVGEGFPPRDSGPGDTADERPAGPTSADPGNCGPARDTDQRKAKR